MRGTPRQVQKPQARGKRPWLFYQLQRPTTPCCSSVTRESVYAVPRLTAFRGSRTAKGTPGGAAASPFPREENHSLLAVSAFEDNVQLLMLTSGGFHQAPPASRRSPTSLQWPDRKSA